MEDKKNKWVEIKVPKDFYDFLDGKPLFCKLIGIDKEKNEKEFILKNLETNKIIDISFDQLNKHFEKMKIGCKFKIEFLGEYQDKNNNNYASYKLEILSD